MGAGAMRIKSPSSPPLPVYVCGEKKKSGGECLVENNVHLQHGGVVFSSEGVCVYLCVVEHLRAGFRATLDAWS